MSDQDEVAIAIAGRRWAKWDALEIHLALDSHAEVSFTAPFEPARKAFRDTFRPFTFQPLEVFVGEQLLFTGTLVDVSPRLESGSRTVRAAAYSKPASLGDVDVPASALPVEATGLSLRQIAERLLQPFGMSAVFEAEDGPAFKRVKTRRKPLSRSLEADEKIGDFLAELARQRGLVVSSTAKGELLFTKSVAPGRPVVRLEEGVPPLLSAVPTFSPQSYYSEITGFTVTKRGRVGAKFTEQNEWLAGGALRPLSFRLNDIDKADGPAAVKAKMGRMFGQMLSVVVEVPTWRDPQGALWRPNTTMTLLAPGAMVYKATEFLIRDVFLRQPDARTRTASLGIVLPGAYSGEQPPELPWEDTNTGLLEDLESTDL